MSFQLLFMPVVINLSVPLSKCNFRCVTAFRNFLMCSLCYFNANGSSYFLGKIRFLKLHIMLTKKLSTVSLNLALPNLFNLIYICHQQVVSRFELFHTYSYEFCRCKNCRDICDDENVKNLSSGKNKKYEKN